MHKGMNFMLMPISCPEVNSRVEQSFECDGSCNQYRAQGHMSRKRPSCSLIYKVGITYVTEEALMFTNLQGRYRYICHARVPYVHCFKR